MPIGTAATGVLKEVVVHEGARVKVGELLATVDCRPIEAEIQARTAQLSAAQATFDRARNGSRPDEIAVGAAAVGYSQARAEEAQKTLDRAHQMQQGVTVTAARVLEVQRDARITAAQLAEARARFALVQAGPREEDIRQAEAARNVASAELAATRARFEQCSVRAPVDGIVLAVQASPGQFFSSAVPAALFQLIQDNLLRVYAEIDVRDLGRVCSEQNATVTAEGITKDPIRGQVQSIGAVIRNRSLGVSGPGGAGSKDVVPIMVNLERPGVSLPFGLPVSVRFASCPPRG
jgi:HlyD family secretion protein